MSDPVDPESPPTPPTEPQPFEAPPTAAEPTFAEPAPTTWSTADQPSTTADEPVPETAAAIEDEDEVDDDDLAAADTAETSPVVRTAPWVSMVTAAGLGIALVVVVEVVIFIAQGIATSVTGLSTMHRIGSGFYNNLDGSQLEILLILATLLLVLPAIGDQGTTESQDRSAALGLAITSAFAVLIGIASVLAVLFELKYFHLQSQGQALSSTARRLLAGYLVRHVGLSVVALIAALSGMKARFAPPAEVADDPAVIDNAA